MESNDYLNIDKEKLKKDQESEYLTGSPDPIKKSETRNNIKYADELYYHFYDELIENYHLFRVITKDHDFTIKVGVDLEREKVKDLVSALFDSKYHFTLSHIIESRLLSKELKDDPWSLAAKLPGKDMIVKNPTNGCKDDLHSVIMYLNDTAKWSRDDIADWIETLDEVPSFGEIYEENKEFTIVAEIERVLPFEA